MSLSSKPHYTMRVREGCTDRPLTCPLCGTESKVLYMGTPPSIECVNFQTYGCGSRDEPDGLSQSPGCKRIVELSAANELLRNRW
jgi:hypothetical protein